MNIGKLNLATLIIITVMFLNSGCSMEKYEATDEDTTGTTTTSDTLNKVLVVPSTITLTSPGEEVEISVLTLSNQDNAISSTVTFPFIVNEQDTSITYGSFSTNEAASQNGIATTVYTAPDTQPSETSKTITISATDASSNEVTATLTLNYSLEQIDTSYKIYASIPDKIAIDDKELISFTVAQSDNSANKASENSISDFSITVLENELVTLKDSNGGSFTTNVDSTNTRYTEVNAGTKSGVTVLEVNATINVGTSSEYDLNQQFALVVQSGPISALSLFRDPTQSAFTDGLFSDTFMVQAVDAYGNPASDGSQLHVGVVSSLRKSTEELFVYNGATISESADKAILTFDSASGTSNFNSVVTPEDSLIILSREDRSNQAYTGGWTIDSIPAWDQLQLEEKYDGTSVTNSDQLTFLVGNNKRTNECSLSDVVAEVDSPDGTYSIQSGKANFELKYSSYLIGHDVYLYANTFIDGKRLGTSIREKLWGTGVTSTSTSASASSSSDLNTTLYIALDNTATGEAVIDVTPSIEVSGTGCSIVSAISSETSCSGKYYATVQVPASGSCTLNWGNTINFEH